MNERKRSGTWSNPHVALSHKTSEAAAMVEALRARSIVAGGPRADLRRDPEALAAALDEMRIQHDELLLVSEELSAQLEEIEQVGNVIAFERARSQHVFAFAPDAYLITDERATVTEANAAALELFERELGQIVGKPLSVLLAHDDVSTHFEMLEVARTQRSAEQCLRVRFRDDARARVPSSAVVSRIGSGDTFFWRFRPALAAVRTTPSVAAIAPVENAVTERLRVLVICHDQDTQVVVEAYVASKLDADVRWVDSIEGALTVLAQFPADIVVADLFVTSETNLDIVTTLRMRNHRPMPLAIAVSGVSSSGSRQALAAGFHAFLTKPVTHSALGSAFQAVTRVLYKRSRKIKARATG